MFCPNSVWRGAHDYMPMMPNTLLLLVHLGRGRGFQGWAPFASWVRHPFVFLDKRTAYTRKVQQMILNTAAAVVPRPRKFKTWKPTKALHYPEWCISKCPTSKDSREGFTKWFINTTPRTNGPRSEGLEPRGPCNPLQLAVEPQVP